MKIILSTRNPSKAVQIKWFFDDPGYMMHTLDEAGIKGEGAEDSDDIVENARSKALFAHSFVKGEAWSAADDTGLFIKHLNGAPGAKAARWVGDVSTDEITQHTLRKLHGAKDRSATFRTAVVLVSPEGKEYVFMGEVEGALLDVPRCKPQPKMPYSPLFVPNGHTKCWAEMSIEEENPISHRGKAFRQMREFLDTLK